MLNAAVIKAAQAPRVVRHHSSSGLWLGLEQGAVRPGGRVTEDRQCQGRGQGWRQQLFRFEWQWLRRLAVVYLLVQGPVPPRPHVKDA